MSGESTSLDNLRDIVLPAPPPFWPPAPGFWPLVIFLLLLILFLGWQFYRRWQARAYRRAGLLLIAKAGTVQEVSTTLKRVALAAFPRAQVASLYGREWVKFLNSVYKKNHFPESALSSPDIPADDQLLGQADQWIRLHRSPTIGER